jgi:hypothetical protein
MSEIAEHWIGGEWVGSGTVSRHRPPARPPASRMTCSRCSTRWHAGASTARGPVPADRPRRFRSSRAWTGRAREGLV